MLHVRSENFSSWNTPKVPINSQIDSKSIPLPNKSRGTIIEKNYVKMCNFPNNSVTDAEILYIYIYTHTHHQSKVFGHPEKLIPHPKKWLFLMKPH